MGAFIPEQILESIRLHADIVQVISEYVNLQKKGKNYVGPCPFHHESDPSFTVTPDKQIFYCFGCNTGGNVFKFIMLQHNLTFPEAVKMLGERVGVAVPDGYSPRVRERMRREEKAYKINSIARDYFHHQLLQHPAASQARDYLNSRGITPEIIKNFSLGFALPAWDDLIKHFQNKNINVHDLLKVGLAVKGDHKAFDRFRSRLMFPITDARGRVVAFGGRVLGDGLPKYLNTSETDFFSKGKILYGLDRARQHIREKGFAIITEGYMDTIAAHQFGIENAIASLGTSLTREHGQLLLNYTNEVVIAFDADAAGVAAAVRGLDILQDVGFRVRVLSLPEGKDPDEFLRSRGIDAWKQQVEKAAPLIEFKLQTALEKYKNVPSSGRETILEELLPTLAAISSELEKNEAIKLIAARLYTSYHAVAEEIRKFTNNNRKKATNPDKIVKNKHNISIRKNRADFGERAEYGLLKLILEDNNLINTVVGELEGNFFKDPFCRGVYEKIMVILQSTSSYTLSVLFDYLDEEYQQKLGALLMEPLPGEDVQEILIGYVSAIKKRQLLDYRDNLQSALISAEKNGNQEEIMRILREIYITDKTLKGGKCCNEGRP